MIEMFFSGFTNVMRDVFYALAPLMVLFFFFQVTILKLPGKQIKRMLKGVLFTFIGLSLFLQGVNVGFLPMGDIMGTVMGKSDYYWMLVPVGLLMGFTVAMAEPTVRVLNTEVENASGGHINKKLMLITLSTGVGLSIAFSMLRVICKIPLLYFIIPGYLAVFIIARHVNDTFVAIAFDAAGAATGPMTVTFIMALTIGASKGLKHGDPLRDGFGMVSMVALMSILSVLILGFLYGRRKRKGEKD
jgi:hypothetical protein